MHSNANTIIEYLNELPEDRKEGFNKLRRVILDNLPVGFMECMSYGMIGYVVPHQLYPNGYHCNPKLPLPFVNIASQKNFIGFYHLGIYGNNKLLNWFIDEYSKSFKSKLDMGKGCIRFKKPDEIPYELIGILIQKISVDNWIEFYEQNMIKKNIKV